MPRCSSRKSWFACRSCARWFHRSCLVVRNDCRDGCDDSGGQRRRISSDGDSNGGSGDLKDSDSFNDGRSFVGICNCESVSDYNGGVWHHVNTVKGAASGSSSSGGVGDIDSGGGVVTDSNGVEADGSDETRDTAGEAVVEGIVVGGSNDADDVDACDNANYVPMPIMEFELTAESTLL